MPETGTGVNADWPGDWRRGDKGRIMTTGRDLLRHTRRRLKCCVTVLASC
jgi:hypothetical protein